MQTVLYILLHILIMREFMPHLILKFQKIRYSMEQSMFLLEMPLKNMKLKMEEGLL